MIICPHCHQSMAQEYYKFCPYCAWQLDKDARRTDFELGRVDALQTIKHDIITWIGGGAAVLTFLAVIIGSFSIRGYLENSVHTEVREEVSRIHTDLRELVEIFPIIKYDFYRIKNIDIDLSLTDYQGREILPSSRHEELVPLYAGIEFRHLSFQPVPKVDFYIDTEYDYKSIQYLKGRDIGTLSNEEKLKINLKLSISKSPILVENQERHKYLKTVNFIFIINDIVFEEKKIQIDSIIINNNNDITLAFDNQKKTYKEMQEKYKQRLEINRIIQQNASN